MENVGFNNFFSKFDFQTKYYYVLDDKTISIYFILKSCLIFQFNYWSLLECLIAVYYYQVTIRLYIILETMIGNTADLSNADEEREQSPQTSTDKLVNYSFK